MRIFAVVAVVTGAWWSATAAATADSACPAYAKQAVATPGPGVLELLADVSPDTRWWQLPADKKRRLQELADHRLAAYRSDWGADALATKQAILLHCPTATMRSAIDRYYHAQYPTVVPRGFTVADIRSPALRDTLVRNYLGVVAARRANLAYPNGTPMLFDWDGESPFDSIRLPDKQAFDDIKTYNRLLSSDLMKIDDAELGDLERTLKQLALFAARSHGAGSEGDHYGSDYLAQACGINRLSYDILAGYEREDARPRMFASDEDVLREVNAIYLNNIQLKWLNVGTRAAAISFCLWDRNRIRREIGDPATHAVAKGMILLHDWWVERVLALPVKKCSIYSPQEREQIWEAFSADQQFNNDHSSSMESYVAALDSYTAKTIARYRRLVRDALERVFPDRTALSQEQYDRVLAAFDRRADFGRFMTSMSEELDAAQQTTDGAAVRRWKAAVAANVGYIGGAYAENEPVRPGDAEEIRAMFAEVKSWIARRYQGFPINIESLFRYISLDVNTRNFPYAEAGTAKIWIGVGTKRSKAEYYSWLLHELRHAVRYAWLMHAPDKSGVSDDEGPANEGSGSAAEDLLLRPFLEETAKNATAVALYALDYGIRDARYTGTTDAALRTYFRTACDSAGDLNSIEFAKSIARSHGLAGPLADQAAERVHMGTQYLQYIWSGAYMLRAIERLQAQIDPTGGRRVDPFVLFACELNTPQRDKAYVDALKACMARR
jgi:hypothetical protein